MFDTHAHLNFAAFDKNFDTVIKTAQKAGVTSIVIPGSNIENSKGAVEIAQQYKSLYAAVGIHPFHVYGHFIYKKDLEKDFVELEALVQQDKVVAVGEVGLDRHPYKSQKYPDYEVSEGLISLQKQVLTRQIKLAIKYRKSLIIHHRWAVVELLEILAENWTKQLSNHTVFHLCQPDDRSLDFAKSHQIFIGVDGDVTYDKIKQEFIKKVPLELLVLETDSPYIIPEPLKSRGEKINTPANLSLILDFIAQILNINKASLKKITSDNSRKLFKL